MGAKTEIFELIIQIPDSELPSELPKVTKIIELLRNSSKADIKNLMKKLESEKKHTKTGKELIKALKSDNFIGL